MNSSTASEPACAELDGSQVVRVCSRSHPKSHVPAWLRLQKILESELPPYL